MANESGCRPSPSNCWSCSWNVRAQLVTREEICQKLWSADTFVDFDHSLGTAINKIREVLNDSAAEPRFVETLPRRGYRFISASNCGCRRSAAGAAGAGRAVIASC